MEIIGKLLMVLPMTNGEGKNGAWQKQEFVIETIEQFPKKICANLWGDKIDMLKNIPQDTVVKVSFNLESREFNNRWYTDVRAWKVELADASTPQGQSYGQSVAQPQMGGYGQQMPPQGYYPPQGQSYGQPVAQPQMGGYGQQMPPQGYYPPQGQSYGQSAVQQPNYNQPATQTIPTQEPIHAAQFEGYNTIPNQNPTDNMGNDHDDLPF